MPPLSLSIFSDVVEKGFCCGCGACAGVCPTASLALKFDKYGELKPGLGTGCISCSLCATVCPFLNGNMNETTIAQDKFEGQAGLQHNAVTGVSLASYYGYTHNADARWAASSGGLTTWLLSALLRANHITGALVVAPTGGGAPLFAYQIARTPEAVMESAKSAYYPVNVSEVMQTIRETSGRYAVVGLPCVIKAIELARKQLPVFRDRIVFTVGLVCGQLKSAHYSNYLARRVGVTDAVKHACYRKKEHGRRAGDFLFQCETVSGQVSRSLPFHAIGHVWAHDWFKVHACNACDDVFAECADIVLMDAWLPRYAQEERGGNLVLVRNSELDQCLRNGAAKGALHLQTLAVDDVIESQRGVVQNKRYGLQFRLDLMKWQGLSVPNKRSFPSPMGASKARGIQGLIFKNAIRLKYLANNLTRNTASSNLAPATERRLKLIRTLIRAQTKLASWLGDYPLGSR